jgi:hypothetical protein
MGEGREQIQPIKAEDEKKNPLQQKLLGLPEQGAEHAVGKFGNGKLIELAWAGPPAAPAGPDFSKAGPADRKALAVWKRMEKDTEMVGGMDNITKPLGESAIERLKALDEDFVDDAQNPVRALRANLIHLRMKELGDHTTGYLTPLMTKFDHAFTAVGNGRGLDQMDDIWLALREVRHIAGRTPDSETDERKVLQTIISENLRKYFPIAQPPNEEPWTDAKPWSDKRKEIAISQMGLSGDKASQLKELEYYHNRFLVATLWAQTNERGRPYGVQSNRTTLNNFILEHLGADLKIQKDASGAVNEGFFGKAEKDAFIRKYGVTSEEADQMRQRIIEVAYDRVAV